ncbi:ATP-binding protein [Algibacillus agarilyticus]|uniref:ATP-binding protein n=1 Tax=Algibacillus agarilyticus TaxID=2234133 RepID=UPI001E4FDFB8|nr:ATP-binding protein [Algibacillus agarilyticus]
MISIRRDLVLLIMAIITLATFSAALQGYKASIKKSEIILDNELKTFAHLLLDLNLQKQPVNLNHDNNLAFQIWQHNTLIVHSLNTPETPIKTFTPHEFTEVNFKDKRWRVYSAVKNERWILIAQPLTHRFELAETLTLSVITPFIIMLPLLGLFIAIIIQKSLLPLSQLSTLLTQKKMNDLSPVFFKYPAKELRPVVDTLNLLFQRLESAFLREKRFASDAAHELRTPLSIIRINSHNLQQSLQPSTESAEHLNNNVQINENISALQAGIDRMHNVIEQILLLNRTNPEQYAAQFTPLDLPQLCQKVISDLYPNINQRQQQIAFDFEPCIINGDTFAITTLFNNLISNASKYTPANAQKQILITLKPNNNPTYIECTIEDSGPGISIEEHNRVFDRFYRVGGDRHSSAIQGCGLGLAIVKHIVDLHQAKISLSTSHTLGGLKVSILFKQRDTTQ